MDRSVGCSGIKLGRCGVKEGRWGESAFWSGCLQEWMMRASAKGLRRGQEKGYVFSRCGHGKGPCHPRAERLEKECYGPEGSGHEKLHTLLG